MNPRVSALSPDANALLGLLDMAPFLQIDEMDGAGCERIGDPRRLDGCAGDFEVMAWHDATFLVKDGRGCFN
jgi:hypothetical protein